jgi:hypothetical protein
LFARNRPSFFRRGALNHFSRQQQLNAQLAHRQINARRKGVAQILPLALLASLMGTYFVVLKLDTIIKFICVSPNLQLLTSTNARSQNFEINITYCHHHYLLKVIVNEL